MSVTQVKESQSRVAFPLFRLGGGWGVTPPITSTCDFDVSSLCRELPGVIPLSVELRGFVFSTCWLSQQLSTPTIDVDEVTLELSACGFILPLLQDLM